MRLLDFFQREDYQPLERGDAFPQFYENGDRYKWLNPMNWHYRFWRHMDEGSVATRCRTDEDREVLLMGGEL